MSSDATKHTPRFVFGSRSGNIGGSLLRQRQAAPPPPTLCFVTPRKATLDAVEDWKPPPPRLILVQGVDIEDNDYAPFKAPSAECVDIPEGLLDNDILVTQIDRNTKYRYYTFL